MKSYKLDIFLILFGVFISSFSLLAGIETTTRGSYRGTPTNVYYNFSEVCALVFAIGVTLALFGYLRKAWLNK